METIIYKALQKYIKNLNTQNKEYRQVLLKLKAKDFSLIIFSSEFLNLKAFVAKIGFRFEDF